MKKRLKNGIYLCLLLRIVTIPEVIRRIPKKMNDRIFVDIYIRVLLVLYIYFSCFIFRRCLMA